MAINMPIIPSKKSGVRFLHCKMCGEERPNDIAPENWARNSVALTPIGLQVWCERHNVNVAHFDFDGRGIRVNVGIRGNGFETVRVSEMPACAMCASGRPHVH